VYGAASVNFARVEHERVGPTRCASPRYRGNAGTAFGYSDHELLMGVWWKGESHIAGAKKIETAADVDPPEPGIVALQVVHDTSVRRAARAYKTRPPSPTYYNRTVGGRPAGRGSVSWMVRALAGEMGSLGDPGEKG